MGDRYKIRLAYLFPLEANFKHKTRHSDEFLNLEKVTLV